MILYSLYNNMRKLLVALLLLLVPASTHAQEYFEIDSFDTTIQMHEDGHLTVTENIEVTFSEPRHGIFRDIQSEDLPIEIISVTKGNEEAWNHQEEYFSEGIRLRIGDADNYVNDKQIYKIKYDIWNAIRFFENHDELYWNSTGNAWPVAIRQATSTVKLPPSLSLNDVTDQACFTGSFGEDQSDCQIKKISESEIKYTSTRKLHSREGMSIALGLTKGTFDRPTSLYLNTIPPNAKASLDEQFFCTTNCEKIYTPGQYQLKIERFGHSSVNEIINLQEEEINNKTFKLIPLWWYQPFKRLLLVISLIITFQPLYSFWKKGRDPKGRGAIVTQYEPPDNLSPAEMGTLSDEKVNLKDISASIVDLAVRGYIDINVLPKAKGWIFKKDDYELIRNKPPRPVKTKRKQPNEFEESLIHHIFGSKEKIKISSLSNKFYKHLPTLKTKTYESLVKAGYFKENPEKVRTKHFVKGFVVMFIGFFILPPEAIIFGTIYSLCIPINGLLSLIFAKNMPRKTEKGVAAYEHILGFQHYLKIAEKDRLKFQENSHLFYEFLPYAMTFGLVAKWSKAFKGILTTPPDWYHGAQADHFYLNDFTSGLSDMGNSVNQAFSSQPSSSSSGSGFSGGFSGGGSGGGGGGSW